MVKSAASLVSCAIHRSNRLGGGQLHYSVGHRGYRDALRDDVDREFNRDLSGLARDQLDVLVDLVEAELFGREDICSGGQVRQRELAIVAGGCGEDGLVADRLHADRRVRDAGPRSVSHDAVQRSSGGRLRVGSRDCEAA